MKPSLSQLLDTLRTGDDSHDNILLLMPDGRFTLFEGAGGGAVSHIRYVTRWETFDAGNGYVGEDAANDPDFFKKHVMPWAERAWAEYQETGRTQIVNLWS